MKSQNLDLNKKLKRQKEHRKDLIVCISILIVILLFVVFLISVSAITHEYGPYMGKVVDKDTGEPIDGAAVLLVFYTESYYGVSSYAGALEVLTDENGEFKLSKKRFFTFHLLNWWEPYCLVTIYKPGYGCFPGHKESGPKYTYSYSIPENEYYTVQLPKLETIEERRKNLRRVYPNGSVPGRKVKNLLKLIGVEEAIIGIKN